MKIIYTVYTPKGQYLFGVEKQYKLCE